MKSDQTLFDIIERADLRPKKRHESLFEYCNVSARRPVVYIRELLETWFRRFPETSQRDLRSRFRSPIDTQHLGAFFELYLHELLIAMGLEVQVHPHLSRGKPTHPDFLVLKRGQRLFYLEATLADSSRDEAAENARISQVYDTLDRIPSSNFFLFIQCNGNPATPPPGARLRQELGQWLSGLDPDEMALRLKAKGLIGLPSYQWSHDGWDLSFIPLPKLPEHRGREGVRPIGGIMPAMKRVTTHAAVRAAIGAKATKYGDLDLPFVIAVNVIDYFTPDIEILNGLLGEEVFIETLGADGTIYHGKGRKSNGAWLGPKGPQNTRVSAALIAIRLDAWEVAKHTPIIIHHPWASLPFPAEEWPLPQWILNVDHARMEKLSGKSTAAVLSLPDSWPPLAGC